jgi:hypothetical protein
MNSKIPKDQKRDYIRQGLDKALQRVGGCSRPYKDIYIVYFDGQIYICDLINKSERIFDRFVSQNFFFVPGYGFISPYGGDWIIILEILESVAT